MAKDDDEKQIQEATEARQQKCGFSLQRVQAVGPRKSRGASGEGPIATRTSPNQTTKDHHQLNKTDSRCWFHSLVCVSLGRAHEDRQMSNRSELLLFGWHCRRARPDLRLGLAPGSVHPLGLIVVLLLR